MIDPNTGEEVVLTADQVAAVMATSRNEEEWNRNCDLIKEAFYGDYPPFWWEAVFMSGVAHRTMANFGSSPEAGVHPHNW
jgi:hypothetical protein